VAALLADETSPDAPRVSVVIPVKDDADRLARCLDALEAQTLGGQIEILVVDNGSSDHVEEAVAGRPAVRLLHEARPSSYAARNRGVAEATGELLAFTDSDCVPAADWLERGYARFVPGRDDIFVGGRVDLFACDEAEPTAVELYELAHGFPQRRYVERLSFAVTANLLVRRDVFQRVGAFSADLISSGDLEWGQRARAAGVRGVYADDVPVAHPARAELREIARKFRRIQEGERQLRRLRGQDPVGLEALRLVVPPLRSIRRSLPKVGSYGVSGRVRYVGVALVAHYILMYERMRVVLGRSAR
jgi:glycosyltransferase involved in cell wall biosynthesis